MPTPRKFEIFNAILLLSLASINSSDGKDIFPDTEAFSQQSDKKIVSEVNPDLSFDKNEAEFNDNQFVLISDNKPADVTDIGTKVNAAPHLGFDTQLAKRRLLARIWLNKINPIGDQTVKQFYQENRATFLQDQALRNKRLLLDLLSKDIRGPVSGKNLNPPPIDNLQNNLVNKAQDLEFNSLSKRIENNVLARVWLDKVFLNIQQPTAAELEQYLKSHSLAISNNQPVAFNDILAGVMLQGGIKKAPQTPQVVDQNPTLPPNEVISNNANALVLRNNTVKPFVNVGMTYDSNFLRLSDGNVPGVLAVADRSEFIKQAAAGLDVNWRFSRQQVLVKASVNQNWFQNFSDFDYSGWNAKTQWNWQLGNNLNGELGYSNVETLGSFVQLNSLLPNRQNTQYWFANAAYLFHPSGRIQFGVQRNEINYNDLRRETSNNIEDTAEFNLQYLSPTNSTAGFRVAATDGRYPQRQFDANSILDNAYTRMNYALTWDWLKSIKTRISGSAGYVQQHHEHLQERDFSDIVAQINLRWNASEKTLLDLSVRREINQANNQFASFVLAQGVWMTLNWQYSPKILVTLPVSFQQQQYLGNLNSNSTGIVQQKDNVEMVGVNLKYSPLENFSIETILSYENRDSNFELKSYETESAGLNMLVIF